jgi:hypothetical protein
MTISTVDAELAERYNFSDFTEDRYGEMLATARGRYSFEPFGTEAAEPHLLWRHDVDFSVHRALRLAQIESEQGVRATYFLSLHSELYNLLEAPVFDRVKAILDLGHWAGLHFDASFYKGIESEEALAERLSFEQGLLEPLLERPVAAFSLHNPTEDQVSQFDSGEIAGMVNAYGAELRERYTYVSDSNGYWRQRRLPEVLEEGAEPRLHVLTHPEWWQAEAMSPRERLARCIEGRALATGRWYDELLDAWGRENVG